MADVDVDILAVGARDSLVVVDDIVVASCAHAVWHPIFYSSAAKSHRAELWRCMSERLALNFYRCHHYLTTQ